MEEISKDKIILPNNPYARATPSSPVVRVLPKISRNSFCPLTNKKFKNCCGLSGQDFCTKAKENLENYLNDLKVDSKTESKDDQKS